MFLCWLAKVPDCTAIRTFFAPLSPKTTVGARSLGATCFGGATTDGRGGDPLLYLAAAKVSEGAPDKSKFSAMAKKLASDSGSEIVDKALQMFGGYGYLKDYPIERFWRDLRVHRILEGTNEVMRMIIGRDLLK